VRFTLLAKGDGEVIDTNKGCVMLHRLTWVKGVANRFTNKNQ
jgi:hypothetical protein